MGLSLLTYLPYARLIGFDTNPKAIKISYKNAKQLGLLDRAMFICQDVSNLNQTGVGQTLPFEKGATYEVFPSCAGNLNHKTLNKFSNIPKPDIIVANPPYIAFNDPRLTKEVGNFEPASALFSEEQGLAHIQAWLKIAQKLLKPNGSYFFEIGANQNLPFLNQKNHTPFKDLSGFVRVIQQRTVKA